MNQDRLKELLSYNSRTGKFTWRVNGSGKYVRVGAIAGTIRKNGYRQICVDGKVYLAGRLAVLWMTGRWPRRLVDHQNRIKADDRWDNLRPANYSTNGANSALHRDSAAKRKGVSFDPRRGHYIAQICVRRRHRYHHFPT
jgi:hypothetical protein